MKTFKFIIDRVGGGWHPDFQMTVEIKAATRKAAVAEFREKHYPAARILSVKEY